MDHSELNTATANAITDSSQKAIEKIIDNLHRAHNEPEKVLSACSEVVHSIVAPALRSPRFHTNGNRNVLVLCAKLCQIPGSLKTWRREVYDSFNEISFFNTPIENVLLWMPVIASFMINDRERINEYIGKISCLPPTGLFQTSREMDALNRQLHIRRLSFIIFSTPTTDQFVTCLQILENKLSEFINVAHDDPILAELFILYRTIFMRFTNLHTARFWPLLLYSLRSVFQSVLQDLDNNLSVLLHACKLLDYLLLVSPEDFKLHEWLFVTDTADSVYRETNNCPIAYMDKLAHRFQSYAPQENISSGLLEISSDAMIGAYCRPIIVGSTISDIHELQPFFSHISILNYERIYSSQVVDIKSCEDILIKDIFR